VIHEAEIHRFKPFIPYGIFESANNFVLLSSTPDFVNFNFSGLCQDHARPGIAEHRRPVRL
jgi:hypothetical protein